MKRLVELRSKKKTLSAIFSILFGWIHPTLRTKPMVIKKLASFRDCTASLGRGDRNAHGLCVILYQLFAPHGDGTAREVTPGNPYQ
jgi:hypothetical protein